MLDRIKKDYGYFESVFDKIAGKVKDLNFSNDGSISQDVLHSAI